ncbi:HAD family hydrolase [Rhodospirillum rubrum]|uniref:HAD-superfamily hydrolase, subfamily IIA n=1 Tax=Rhodospirillum rubrum (strain ATCC 11170 / ATH 1.1.1 / DSM 467 / LMG 4362 / NCIMB 8255 / S1) TaxID=269796 RepID=Q2RTF0_RHORT|nr:HAD family hydrolase [Rhodospirillum rubrum]ABC22595.1 HAD-superfamily hydrolase, subfamily IIA [Rhodospirillum rubrum ATCC 11170]AEO48313.1 HAD family hydrolase [Rhodospirillum rubrum F11]MBK5954183.1 HAD family hydrolase [Rhodospirillum rubrum]QXG82220.1 HAD family hydrolase [Rhodospirillum rubrum]HAP98991.1 HAD-IIA family hydrolase [Rhodospirillum rubrum]
MLFLEFAAAWDVYLAAAPFLPSRPAPPIGGCRRIEGVGAVADAFDLIVLDAYGVLHEGAEPYPAALEAFAALRARGKAVCVVTNAVTHAPGDVAARLTALGFPLDAGEVVSGRSLLPDLLAGEQDQGSGIMVLGSHTAPVQERFPQAIAQDWTAEALDRARGFLLIDTNGWMDDEPESRLGASLRANPRPLIVCNPDVTCPFLGKLSYEPGYFAFRLAAEIPDLPLRFLGKPYGAIYDRVAARFPGIARERILAVGDSPHTDVLGARSAGMAALLVESGLFRGRDTGRLLAECAILPDFIAPHL